MIKKRVHPRGDRCNRYIGISQNDVVSVKNILVVGAIDSIVEVILKKTIAIERSVLAVKRFRNVMLASKPRRFENFLMHGIWLRP